MKNLVIIPTYNEKENIESIIKAISSLDVAFDILVIDDNSPDKTAQIVKSHNNHSLTSSLLKEKGNLVLVLLILPDLSGLSRKVMTLSLKWMPIFHTIPAIL